MSIEIIDLLKPKNGLSFKLIEDIDIAVTGYESLADAVSHFATTAMIEAINLVLSGKQDKLTTAQLNAVNSGITSELVTQIGTNTTAIANKVDASALTAATASLQAQIDNIVTPATQDAEVQNARIGEDGTSYVSLKSRLDNEQTEINDKIGNIKTLSTDEAITFTEEANGLKESNGVISDSESTQNYFHTYISVTAGETYRIKTYVGTSSSYPYYIYAIVSTADKTVVGRYAPKEESAAYKTYNITVPVGATALGVMRYKSSQYSINITKVISEIVPLQTQISSFDKNMPININLHNSTTDTSGLINDTGSVTANASYSTTQHIAVWAGYTYTISDHCRRFVAFNSSSEVIVGSYDSTDYGDNPKTFTASVNGSIRFSFINTANPVVTSSYSGTVTRKNQEGVLLSETQKGQVNTAIAPLSEYIETHDKYMPQKLDLHNTATDVSGLIEESGAVNPNDSYQTTDYIPMKQGYTYIISDHCRKFDAFDTSKAVISGSYDNTDYGNEPKSYAALQNGYIRFSFINTASPTVAETFTGTPTLKCGEGILLSETQKRQVEQNIYNQDVLYGKKWVVVGDSFTNGGTYDDIIPSGLYAGKKALYHYLIGNRHLMNVVHFAAGGRTMTTPETIISHNCFSDTESTNNYTDVPADADYITIWLGINDSKTETGEASVGETPLGTIDDDTVHTFYGAWNVVLEYLLEHNPYAHIGIIVSNGCTGTNYPNAIKAVARKWGIAYLDLNDDYTIPLMHRVNGKSEVCERAIELRKSAFWVSSTNGHPNAHAQAYQSTFIENWLRTL